MKHLPVEEVKSLVGKIDKSAMGGLSSHDKPKKERTTKKKQEEW